VDCCGRSLLQIADCNCRHVLLHLRMRGRSSMYMSYVCDINETPLLCGSGLWLVGGDMVDGG
jgi:hypothetical protein